MYVSTFHYPDFVTTSDNYRIFFVAPQTGFHSAYDFSISACKTITLTVEQYRLGRTKPQSSFYNTGNARALTAELTLWLGLMGSWNQWPCLKMEVQAGIQKMGRKGEGWGRKEKKLGFPGVSQFTPSCLVIEKAHY